MRLVDAPVISNQEVCPGVCLLHLRAPDIAAEAVDLTRVNAALDQDDRLAGLVGGLGGEEPVFRNDDQGKRSAEAGGPERRQVDDLGMCRRSLEKSKGLSVAGGDLELVAFGDRQPFGGDRISRPGHR